LSSDEYLHGISDEALEMTIATLHRLCEVEDGISGTPATKELRCKLFDCRNELAHK
jgi:hypothetical protein